MITKPKGTIDIFGNYGKKWQYVEAVINDVFIKYNYTYTRTPIFESTALFNRGVGETTDIVNKEMYDFKDKGDREITLRPEGTAGIVRLYIENKLYGEPLSPMKLFYQGTMYRYERPQSGRLREFSQYGCETIGSNDPAIDAEVIALAMSIYRNLGLKKVTVHLNSLGDIETRKKYHEALINYFKPHIKDFCHDCQERLEKNPLRILDCKIDAENELVKNAPKIIDYLSDASKERYNQVKKYLESMNINYIEDPFLVRGLDYYTDTVFEIITTYDEKDITIAGGGRYNNLIKELDGPDTPAMGFAGGMDRLMMILEDLELDLKYNDTIDAYIMYVNDNEKEYAIALNESLRNNGFITDTEYMNRTLKAQFKQADRLKARFLIILNSDDIKNGFVNVKDNLTKEEQKIEEGNLIDFLDMNM